MISIWMHLSMRMTALRRVTSPSGTEKTKVFLILKPTKNNREKKCRLFDEIISLIRQKSVKDIRKMKGVLRVL